MQKQILRYRRENSQRIFVNRNIYFERIQFIGFDMDYTLAEYISPDYEALTYKYALEYLISIGYPQELTQIKYDPKFATRGVIFDKKYGNFLKIDPYGNIMSALHGLSYLEINRTHQFYKNRFIDIADTERFKIFNSLFEFPSMFLISSMIEFLEKNLEWKLNESGIGVEKNFVQIYYETIGEDVLGAFNTIHKSGNMKKETVENIEKYIRKDTRLPLLLKHLKVTNRRLFLVTNSDYWYTNKVLSYLFKDISIDNKDLSEDWKTYFDITVVNAMKPKFFAEGTSMCQVDLTTGKQHIGVYKGKISSGDVFSGGNSETLCEILGAHGKDILYVGDHIFGDILKSKKKQGWKTYLVVPELITEIHTWISLQHKYKNIDEYEASLSLIYKNMDFNDKESPSEIKDYISKIREETINIEKSYGVLGSLLRCGQRQTFFASQLLRYADLYSHTCLNLLNYPYFYLFRCHALLMPHEATIKYLENLETICKDDESDTKMTRQPLKSARQYTICADEMAEESIS